jgi:hypothetical protein
MHPNALTGKLYAVQVPDGLKAGQFFEAEVPGLGLEQVTVPEGVHGGQVIDIETKHAPNVKLLEHTHRAHVSAVADNQRTSVSVPPPQAPPPLTSAQREEVRQALGHETYQMVVDEALHIDSTAKQHEATAAEQAASALHAGDTITINGAPASIDVGASAAAPHEQTPPRAHIRGAIDWTRAQAVQQRQEQGSVPLPPPRQPAPTAAMAQHMQNQQASALSMAASSAGAAAASHGVEVAQMPTALKKAARSVHKMISEQEALESSVQNLEAVTKQFVDVHSHHEPVATKGESTRVSLRVSLSLSLSLCLSVSVRVCVTM